MKKFLLLLVLLSVTTPFVNGQQAADSSAAPKPDSGSFIENTYKSDFFGFSYLLPGEWQKSRAVGGPPPPGAYYLFIGDRHTGHPLMSRVIVIADAQSNYHSRLSAQQYVSTVIDRQIEHAHGDLIRLPSAFVVGGNHFERADYKTVQDGVTLYKSMVCTDRNGYWLSWTFAAPSERELDDAVNTLQHVSFDRRSPRSR